MILDDLKNIGLYENVHPLFPMVFEWLKQTPLAELKQGRINLEAGVFINVDEAEQRAADDALLEVHDKYIDIQVPIISDEQVGYAHREDCKNLIEKNEAKDYSFFKEPLSSLFSLRVGAFCVFFPDDAHAPLIGTKKTRKIVVKIPVIK